MRNDYKEIWLGRDLNGHLYAYCEKPELNEAKTSFYPHDWETDAFYGDAMTQLPSEMYPDVTFENSPQRLTIDQSDLVRLYAKACEKLINWNKVNPEEISAWLDGDIPTPKVQAMLDANYPLLGKMSYKAYKELEIIKDKTWFYSYEGRAMRLIEWREIHNPELNNG